jgi:hypothetical protein
METSDFPYHGIIEYIPYKSYADFFKAVISQDFSKEGNLFRGQCNPTWRLVPTAARDIAIDAKDYIRNYKRKLDEILSTFKNRLSGYHQFHLNEMDENEIWQLGRHHGLKTPLLDWTFSPFIAAFFAYSDYFEKSIPGKDEINNVIVYQLKNQFSNGNTFTNCDLLTKAAFEYFKIEADTECKELILIREIHHSNPRQISQCGIFTKLDSIDEIDLIYYLNNKRDVIQKDFKPISAHLLPTRDSEMAIVALDKMNINYSTLYPDIEGVVRYANMKGKVEDNAYFKGLLKAFVDRQ